MTTREKALRAAIGREVKVRTNCICPPIPIRKYDWSAVDDSTYDGPGCSIGYGRTEQEAIEDLLAQMVNTDKFCPHGFTPRSCSECSY